MPIFKAPEKYDSETPYDSNVAHTDDELDSEDELDDISDVSALSGLESLSSMGFGNENGDAAVKELLSSENLLLKTDLSPAAIPIVARIVTLAQKYEAQNMKNFIWAYLKLRVSKNRKGRDEIVAVSLRRQGMSEFEDDF